MEEEPRRLGVAPLGSRDFWAQPPDFWACLTLPSSGPLC